MLNVPNQNPRIPATGYVRLATLLGDARKGIRAIIPFSRATLYRKVKSGDFPSPVKLSERISAWRVEEIQAWMDSIPNIQMVN